MPQEAAMSTNHHTSRLFAVALIALLLGAGGFGYWRSTQDRLPEGIGMGNGRLESTEVQIAAKIPGRLQRQGGHCRLAGQSVSAVRT